MEQNALHVAIIMDGNGRWATSRNLPRRAGHRAGADAVRRIVEAAPDHGIRILTLFAFSSDNWQRPRLEVQTLMRLLHTYLIREIDRCLKEGVRLSFIGRRDRIPKAIASLMARAETLTAKGKVLDLRIAVDYSGRDAILRAAERLAVSGAPAGPLSREAFARALADPSDGDRYDSGTPDVDLLVRTGGELRVSDFLLWECAYAELYFTPLMWPEFDSEQLGAAVEEFRRRQRRFGQLPDAAAI